MTMDVVAEAQRLLEQRRDALDALGFSDDLAWDAEHETDMDRRHFAVGALMMQKALEGVIQGNHDPVALAEILKDTLPAARHSTEILRHRAEKHLRDGFVD